MEYGIYKITMRARNIVTAILIFLLGVGSGVLLIKSTIKHNPLDSLRPMREHNNSYRFIHPLLAYDVPTDRSEYQPLKDAIQRITAAKISDGSVMNASVYFRDLSRGRWIGVNEKETYEPASLLKVAIMVGYLKLSESDPKIMEKELVYHSDQLAEYETPSSLENGRVYTIAELIRAVIVDSDNGAKDLLLRNIDVQVLSSVYESLGIQDPERVDTYKLSAQDFSLFLRVLYNATFLNRASSEKALEWLSQTTFKDGIVAGVPSHVMVAHKFGERVIAQNGVVKYNELHDCGIVYEQNTDYLICVMTRGSDLSELKSLIQDISREVHKSIVK